MTQIKPVLLMLLLAVSSACGRESGSAGELDIPFEEHESLKKVDGFGGWVVVITDEGFDEITNGPVDAPPNYDVTSNVAVGDTVMTLIFFANPAIDDEGNAEIRCDLKVTRPDGSMSHEAKDSECYKGPSNPYYDTPDALQLSKQYLEFFGEEDDLRGEWITDIRLTDVVRGVSLDLRTRFVLSDSEY